MNKRISLVSEVSLLCEVVIVLTDSQRKKLENGQLRETIDNIALDMHVCWSIEVNGNTALGLVGRECGTVIDSDTMHQVEIAATNFMSAIDKLQIPEKKDEPSLIDFDDNPGDDKKVMAHLEFVKLLLHDMDLPSDNDRHVRGALIIDTTTHPLVSEPTCWGHIGYDLLKEMCKLYINKYGQN